MIAEILATGDEIRSGALIDSNSAYIAEKLEEVGIPVKRHSCVGDDFEVLVSILKEISTRVDICVVTGGLGPTTDDLSSEAAAAAAGDTLVLDTQALDDIETFFRSRKREMVSSNRKQAMLPRTAEAMYNPVGTAPGFSLKIDRCVFFFLPGVPHEMKRMLSNEMLPRIEKISGALPAHCLVKNITTFGLTESATGEKVAPINDDFPEIKLGLRAKFPEIHVKLYLNGQDLPHMEKRLALAAKWIQNRLGRHVLSLEGASLPEVVGGLLRKEFATVAVAESCTGGRIANWLTNVPGSSDYFHFSGVTYSNHSKTNVLGVAPGLLKAYGAVHEETAKAMAEGARRISGATYAISTTGIAGPTGGTDDKPVGTVCIGLATPDKVEGKRLYFPFGQRSMNKSIFGMAALNMLRKELLK
jgi:competence/damage-inducible protein CinA-like protein